MTTGIPMFNRTLRRAGLWIRDAACAGTPTDRFYPESYQEPDPRALAICRDCPVRIPCLAWALSNNEQHGIFGGLTARQRTGLRRRLRKAAA